MVRLPHVVHSQTAWPNDAVRANESTRLGGKDDEKLRRGVNGTTDGSGRASTTNTVPWSQGGAPDRLIVSVHLDQAVVVESYSRL